MKRTNTKVRVWAQSGGGEGQPRSLLHPAAVDLKYGRVSVVDLSEKGALCAAVMATAVTMLAQIS